MMLGQVTKMLDRTFLSMITWLLEWKINPENFVMIDLKIFSRNKRLIFTNPIPSKTGKIVSDFHFCSICILIYVEKNSKLFVNVHVALVYP